MSGRCELSDLPTGQCACRLHATPEPPDPFSRPGFTAYYHGTYPSCDGAISPGDRIVRHHDEYLHEECL
jgi:hypothetical protein